MWANIKYWFKQHDYQWKYKLVVCLPLFVFLVLADIIPKIVIQKVYTQGEEIGSGWIHFHYVINPGSAEGGLANNIGATIAIACVITLIALAVFMILNDRMWLIALVFVIAGSVANLLARSWAPTIAEGMEHAGTKGGVIDFLDTSIGGWGFINNIADIEVSIFVILFVIFAIVEVIKYFVQANKEKEVVAKTTGSQTERARGDIDESTPSAKQKREKVKEEKVLRNNMTDRKANAYEQQRELTAKEIKAQKKLEKMSKNEHKNK